MQVNEFMTTSVVRIKADTKLRHAVETMLEHQVDGVPVVDDRNQCVGILTYADLLRTARRHQPMAFDFFFYAVVIEEDDAEVVQRLERMLDQPVGQVCTRNVITCAPEDSVSDVVGLMTDHHIKRVPVVGAGGNLVGIVTRKDLMRAIWKTYREREEQA